MNSLASSALLNRSDEAKGTIDSTSTPEDLCGDLIHEEM